MYSLRFAMLYRNPCAMIISREHEPGKPRGKAQMLRIMRLLVFFLFVSFMSAHASGVSQTVTLSAKRMPLEEVFATIEKQTGFVVFFNRSLLTNTRPVTIKASNTPLESFLQDMLANQPVSYKIEGKTIFISRKTMATELAAQAASVATALEAAFEPDPIVTGIVRNQKGEPLSGAAVKVQGSSAGTATDAKGAFSLRAGKGQIIVVSFTGYKETPVVVTGSSMQIAMETVENVLDDVVVGYGSVKKKDFTGSAAQVNVAELQKQNAFNFDVALAGRAPGVMVVKSSGAPGADATIRIRGASSAFGVNEPLYVIDGVPVQISQGMGATDFSSNRSLQLSPLSAINPQDIESIDILKDASSTAIYGSRAANGVVLVTTKHGKAGQKAAVTLSYNASFDRFYKDFTVLSSSELLQVAKEAYANAGQTIPADFIRYQGVSTNWKELVTRTSYSDDWNLGLTGGTPNGETVYALSASANKQIGVIKATGIKRYSLRGNVESQASKLLKLGINMSYTNNGGDALFNTFYTNIVTYRPDIPVFDENGNYATPLDSSQGNPVARTTYQLKLNNDALFVTGFLELKPFSFLKLRSSIAYNKTENQTENFAPSYDPLERKAKRTGSRTDNTIDFQSVIFENTATYNTLFRKHAINAVAGASFTSDKRNTQRINSINFPDDYVLTNLGSAGTIQQFPTSASVSGLESYFGRMQYNYDSKYYFTFTARTDKSTKFGPNNQWAFFPSASAAWRMSKETFLGNTPWISDLKLRASYGITGISNLADFLYASFFSTAGQPTYFYNGQSGVGLANVPNPSLRWETSRQFDIGFDYTLFNNRVRGSVEYYHKATKDLLLNVPIPRETGFGTTTLNIGNISNRGVEVVLGGDVIVTKNLTYTSEINFSQNRSRLDKLNGGSGINLKEGDPLGTIKGYQTAGIFQTAAEITALNSKSPNGFYQVSRTAPGDFKFVDQNGDNYVSTSDMVNIGNVEPKFYGGWNNVVRYKWFEATAFFYYAYGQEIQNQAKKTLGIYVNDVNYDRSVLNAWRPDNTQTDHPRNVRLDPNNNIRVSDYYVQDGSFFKLKNLQFACYLNTRKITRSIVNQVKIYASVQNLFIITKYEGVDPEVGTTPVSAIMLGGFDSGAYPSTRTFNVGFSVNF